MPNTCVFGKWVLLTRQCLEVGALEGPRSFQGLWFPLRHHTLNAVCILVHKVHRCRQGSSERVRYFAERVLNVRSDQQIKNAFRTRSFRCISEQLQCCLTARPYCLHSVFFCYCYSGQIYDNDDDDDDNGLCKTRFFQFRLLTA